VTRAVLDPNVIVAAALNPHGIPAQCMRAHADGRFELVVSDRLLDELSRVLRREKFRRYLSLDQAERLVDALRRDALVCRDPPAPAPVSSPDRDDDYLLALAFAESAHVLVSGDAHLLGLRPPGLRIVAPRDFLTLLPG
jgi:hypothetical protein